MIRKYFRHNDIMSPFFPSQFQIIFLIMRGRVFDMRVFSEVDVRFKSGYFWEIVDMDLGQVRVKVEVSFN